MKLIRIFRAWIDLLQCKRERKILSDATNGFELEGHKELDRMSAKFIRQARRKLHIAKSGGAKGTYKNMIKLHEILYESTRHLDHHHRTMDMLKLEDNEQYMTMMYNHVYWGMRLGDRYDGRFNQNSVYDALMRMTFYEIVREIRKEIYYTDLMLED